MADTKDITRIEDLEMDSGNANKGTPRGRGMLENSLRELGAGRSIVVDKRGRVIGGNKTLEVAVDIGMENIRVVKTSGHELVIVQREDLDLETDDRARKLAIADNRVGEVDLEWDPSMLARQLQENASLAGNWLFSQGEIAKILSAAVAGTAGLLSDVPVPLSFGERLQAKWATAYGQVWSVGRHRFMCGDSTKQDDVERLVEGNPVALLLTSPPYWTGQEYDDKPGVEAIKAFMASVADAWKSIPIRRLIIQTGHTNSTLTGDGGNMHKILLDSLWTDAFHDAGWLLRHRRVWMKGGGLLHVSPAADLIDESWEVMLTFYRPGHNEGGQERVSEGWAQKGYWDDIAGVAEEGHPCPFPAELARRLTLLYTKTGDIVIDPFLGSGSTAVAAEQIGRVCLGMELSPAYLAVALERMSVLGLDVTLEDEA